MPVVDGVDLDDLLRLFHAYTPKLKGISIRKKVFTDLFGAPNLRLSNKN